LLHLANDEIWESNQHDILAKLDAFCNLILVFTAVFYTLYSLDKAYSKKQISKLLIGLSDFIHLIDMHQINKDPNHLKDDYVNAKHSPVKTLNKFELQRYLDYTSESIALGSKMAYQVLECFPNDQKIMSRVNELHILCDGITTNIWQKIIILDSIEE